MIIERQLIIFSTVNKLLWCKQRLIMSHFIAREFWWFSYWFIFSVKPFLTKKYHKSAICRYKQVSSILSIIPNNKKLSKTIKINKKLTKYQKKNWKIYVNIFFTLFGRTNRKSAWLWKDTRSQRTDERLPDRSMFAFLFFYFF